MPDPLEKHAPDGKHVSGHKSKEVQRNHDGESGRRAEIDEADDACEEGGQVNCVEWDIPGAVHLK